MKIMNISLLVISVLTLILVAIVAFSFPNLHGRIHTVSQTVDRIEQAVEQLSVKEFVIVEVPQPPVSTKNVIQITDTGLKPTSLTIKKGEVVTFISKATAPVWPAGDDHPTHDAYPSVAYAKEGDQAKSFGSKACVEYGIRKGDVFDPCKLLLPEETFTFRFNEKGTWGFHNHVRPEHTGKIIVG
ncbi:MAG: hypothetical protein IH934_00015 [Nanoarchaeota archaeon]|nr:hypothetical protein [Nanoarchaeota archaeon]